ncbi:hypothetical protein [Mesorhizobium sp. B2-1-5]|uniref:hypothetical protein n=1 Tax=Mesorhizobium sp. B2-1-5 TaxID=2589969 RepID=UPI0011283A4C|nr:hypothetical protein [Mesorhizobium sp. B2-1-5]TPM94225.1 hypothetical protein FJ966_18330 [Mesorhizobium sp. B2-1-5]
MKRIKLLGALFVLSLPAFAQESKVETPKDPATCKPPPGPECVSILPWEPSSGTDGISDSKRNFLAALKAVDQQEKFDKDVAIVKLPEF